MALPFSQLCELDIFGHIFCKFTSLPQTFEVIVEIYLSSYLSILKCLLSSSVGQVWGEVLET